MDPQNLVKTKNPAVRGMLALAKQGLSRQTKSLLLKKK